MADANANVEFCCAYKLGNWSLVQIEIVLLTLTVIAVS